MISPPPSDPSNEAATKVLKRAHVSKVTRALQDRLALANLKMSRGWQNRSFRSIESELQGEFKRKRSDSAGDMPSDTSSSASSRIFSSNLPISSPLTAPMSSDNITGPKDRQGYAKRRKTGPTNLSTTSRPPSLENQRPQRPTLRTWKSDYRLPESSPPPRQVSKLNTNMSFVSETSTVLDSASASEDDDQDIPLHRPQKHNDPVISSSPPRTPTHDGNSSNGLRSGSLSSRFTDRKNAGKEGADLLLYLASSPSPVTRVNKTPMLPPSTPPAKNTPLPSSMMTTPGGQMYLGFGPNTPSSTFNFADFVNVTPSPAQGGWSRTPVSGNLRTPVAARETRRRLNFASPNVGSARASSNRKGDGLGMELGGELVS